MELRLRPLRETDIDTIVVYRNIAEVAHFQDWDLPVQRSQVAARLTDSAEKPEGPVAGEWTTLVIEIDDGAGPVMVGDVAVGLHPTAAVATIGYTLRPDYWGRGIASRAVSEMLERLFTVHGITRVQATIDPNNVASARLLEGQGFRWEGMSPASVVVRGELVDDERYGLSLDGWRAWNSRPQGPVGAIELVEITPSNLETVERLATFRWQRRFVSPMERSFADALVPEPYNGVAVVPWYRAVVADGEICAFVMMTEATAAHPEPYLWRLLIDRSHQRRGIGSMIIEQLTAMLRNDGHRSMTVSYSLGPGTPEPFYRRFGFEPTGEIDDGETVARLRF